jgi:hypothetical protein
VRRRLRAAARRWWRRLAGPAAAGLRACTVTSRRALPASTLEISEPHAFLYGSRQAADALVWYELALHRMAAAGAPVTITTVAASLAGSLLHVTYPATGEQLALAARDRLIGQGVPRSALRATGEAAP